jgi:hypothetical protein
MPIVDKSLPVSGGVSGWEGPRESLGMSNIEQNTR